MSHALCLVSIDAPCPYIQSAVKQAMQPFDENDEWFKHGSRWDWWQIGGRYSNCLPKPIIQIKELKAKIDEFARKRAEELWKEFQAASEIMKPFWKIPEGETWDSYIERHSKNKLTAHAFLRSGIWHENERLGFFGCTAKSECQIAGRDEGKCLVGDLKNPPAILGFNESNERWDEHFWNRFIAPLPDESWLVAVDYHV